jgi:hypothetical protein
VALAVAVAVTVTVTDGIWPLAAGSQDQEPGSGTQGERGRSTRLLILSAYSAPIRPPMQFSSQRTISDDGINGAAVIVLSLRFCNGVHVFHRQPRKEGGGLFSSMGPIREGFPNLV